MDETVIPPRAAPRGRPRRSAEATRDLRARVLAAAQALFAQGGYEGVSMRNVAKAASCSAPALYRLFPHKRALLRNIWDDVLGELDRDLAAAAAGRARALDRLGALGRGYVRFWVEHPDHFRALFLIEDRLAEPGERYFVDTSENLPRMVARFEEAAKAASAAGELTGDPREIIELLFCGLHGVASGVIGMPEYPWGPPDLLAGRMVDALLAGLAP
ncbi:MAG: TetR/AcrR family transcriptional regulator [Caulobacteraceae bacterium]|jgi:AcrR family transcriptional regulator|nr:TetR/AcrR family transcriptional regulator [Caulobacteraceae bacterium]